MVSSEPTKAQTGVSLSFAAVLSGERTLPESGAILANKEGYAAPIL